MRSLYASLLAVASLTSILWITVDSQGKQHCADPSYKFQTVLEVPQNRAGADMAKLGFCKTVNSLPMY
jgi:hypothetical protein